MDMGSAMRHILLYHTLYFKRIPALFSWHYIGCQRFEFKKSMTI